MWEKISRSKNINYLSTHLFVSCPDRNKYFSSWSPRKWSFPLENGQTLKWRDSLEKQMYILSKADQANEGEFWIIGRNFGESMIKESFPYLAGKVLYKFYTKACCVQGNMRTRFQL